CSGVNTTTASVLEIFMSSSFPATAGRCGSKTITQVQRDHAGREIVEIDPVETGLLHHGLERCLVRVHPDRFREIAVARGIAGGKLSEPRQYLETVPIVRRRERSPDA